MTGPTVTVAVVVKDRLVAMQRCLGALAALDPTPDQIVLVDNGSTDGTRELLSEWSHPTAAVVVGDAMGPVGAARNAALALTTEAVVAWTDSDCQPEPGWLGPLIAPFGSAEDVHVVQGTTVPDGEVQAPWPATQDLHEFTDRYEACNIAYRTEVLREAGGFGSAFFGEDTAAGWRVRRLGGRGVHAPDAVVLHDLEFPGFRWHLRRTTGYANLPMLVAEFPEMRRELLTLRVFLRPRSVAIWGLIAGGLGVVVGRPRAGMLALPYLARRRPDAPTIAAVRDQASAMVFDLAVAAALVRGSVRHRTPVL